MKHLCIIPLGSRRLAASCLMLLLAGGLRAAISTNAEVKPVPVINSATGLPEGGTISINPSTGLPEKGGTNGGTNLVTRIFRVDRDAFTLAIAQLEPATTNIPQSGEDRQKAVRGFFSKLGVDLRPPKAVFFNDRRGSLFVHATLADLDVIEQAIQVVNPSIPQVNIRVESVEVPEEQVMALFGPVGVNTIAAQPFTGILTESQAKALFETLDHIKGVDVISAPEVTTLSGRQTQVQITEMRTIVTGLTTAGITNGANTNIYQTTPMPFGPALDVIPHVIADGYTIQMTLMPVVTEILGYEKPASAPKKFAWENDAKAEVPIPRVHVRQLNTTVIVRNGQTIVIGGMPADFITKEGMAARGDLYEPGHTFRKSSDCTEKKQLFIFLTPTIFDQAGNRIQRGEEKMRDWPKVPSKLPPDWK
jgi:hypothetical protein